MMIKFKKILKTFSIILISLIIISALIIHFSILYFYNKGLKALPKDLSYIDKVPKYEKFNKCLWIEEAGDIPQKIKPINHYYYILTMFINSSNYKKLQELNKKNGWGISSITARLIINNSYYKKPMLTWHLAFYSVSVWVSKNIPADKCLSLIADNVYLGNNYYGIKEASSGYFNKKPDDLTTDEIIYLLVLFRSPGIFDPKKHPEQFEKRRLEIKQKLSAAGII